MERNLMKDNDLGNFIFKPMAASHFEVASKEVSNLEFSEVAIKAVRAVLVERLDPEIALVKFHAPREEFKSALQCYSAAWEKYCVDNDLVTGEFWLPPDVAAMAKSLESRALNRIERRRK
jgi:hypothetical protein